MPKRPELHVVGDPHLGRQFVHGVPLHRRGEREKLVWAHFQRELMVPADVHVCLGDLFDKAVVSYDTIVNAAMLYIQVATQNPDIQYFVLRGNHDISKDLTRRSAFDVFSMLVRVCENIHVVTDQIVQYRTFAFAGYNVEKVELPDTIRAHTLFGHYDVDDYGGDNHNLVPTERAAELGIKRIITGHVHKPRTFERHKVEVVVHGSLEPYAHGEEIDDSLYVTLTPEELALKDPAYLRDRCVRVLGLPGMDVDCLQLAVKRPETVKSDLPPVEFSSFNIEDMFKEAFSEAGVSATLQEQILTDYRMRRMGGDS